MEGTMDCLLSLTCSKETILLLSLTVFTWILYEYLRRPKNLPPGPWGLPLLGYVPAFLASQPQKKFAELTKQYGDVVSVRLGRKLVVILGSFESVKEALVKQGDAFAGRLQVQFLPGMQPGLARGEGDIWRDQRRFSLSTLRDFGFGKQTMEVQIVEEIRYLIKEISVFNGKPTDIANLLRMSVANVISGLVFGKRFHYSDSNFQTIMQMVNEQLQDINPISIKRQIPWLQDNTTNKQKTNRPIMKFLKEMADQHKETHQAGSERDYIDAWLTERQSEKVNKEYFKDDHLAAVSKSLFIAGSDTTASTLRWAILYMMLNPEIQKKVQLELDEKIGNERMSSMNDRANVPYTEAVILEIQRMSTITPFAVPHRTLKDVTLHGYHIPKDTSVLPNLWGIHHDPTVYPAPDKLCPERYLDEDGKLKKHDVIPFSIGKRSCMGESLARNELFLYFTSLMQSFTFKLPEEDPTPNPNDIKFGIILVPKYHRICAVPRQTSAVA